MSETLIIGDHNAHIHQQSGNNHAKGCIPRNYDTHPRGTYGSMEDIPLIPMSEYPERIKDKIATKSQLSDIRNVGNNGQRIPSRDQNGKGYCLLGHTLIRMADGTQKRIDEIKLLDEVLTAEGNIHAVQQLHVRNYGGDLVTIKSWGHGHLKMTPNHSVLTKRGYVPAGELTGDDWICALHHAPQTSKIILTSEHMTGVKRRIKNEANGEARWETRLPAFNDGGCVRPLDVIEMTPDAGWIFGIWLAEGHVDESTWTVVWSFNANETDTLVKTLVDRLESEWGVSAKVVPGPASPNVVQVEVQSKLWCQLFVSLCGKWSWGKRLHADLTSGPRDFLESLFDGWMAGDGSVRGRDGSFREGATVSHVLAMNMYDIANALEMHPSIYTEKGKPRGNVKSRRDVYKIKVNNDPKTYRLDYRHQMDVGKTWRKVRGIETEQYVGKVYNIGVEKDNTYVAEGIGVHNCWFHSGTAAVIYLRAAMGLPYVDLSAYMGACIIKDFQDEGGWGAQGVDFLTEKGVCSSQFWPQQSMSRANVTDEMWANAKLHRISEGWNDLAVAQYDRVLSDAQICTLLLSNIPVVTDFNWWGHSVLAIDLVDGKAQFNISRDELSGKLLTLEEFDMQWGMATGVWPKRIQNSWGDSWSDNGTGILTGTKAQADGAVAPRNVFASVV